MLHCREAGDCHMDFDVEHKIISTITELFELALQEATTEADYDQAVEHIVRDVLSHHPGFSTALMSFAMGVAVGRREGRTQGNAEAKAGIVARSTRKSRWGPRP